MYVYGFVADCWLMILKKNIRSDMYVFYISYKKLKKCGDYFILFYCICLITCIYPIATHAYAAHIEEIITDFVDMIAYTICFVCRYQVPIKYCTYLTNVYR